jgi:hydroxymethylglutaryl-CoA lyase
MLTLPEKVTIVDVSARDGLQSFHRWVETDTKVRMVNRLTETGFPVIEVTGFSHPKVVPHLRDAEEVMARIQRKPDIVYRALAPNARGAERAVAAKAQEILGLATASESYSQKNQNMTLEQGLNAAIETFQVAERAGIPFLAAISMAWWSPYEGAIPEERVFWLVRRLRDAGIRRFYLADTLGMEAPRNVNTRFRRLREEVSDIELGFHVHNRAGNGAANVVAALDAGASFIEGSICGIGGGITTPANMGTFGNLATEDIVSLLNEMELQTGVSTDAALLAARDIAAMLGIEPRSHLTAGGTRSYLMEQARANPKAQAE